MKVFKKLFSPLNLRGFIFGFEDSVVSTVGLLSGIAFSGVVSSQIVLTGVILIFVEAFSMGVGMYLSESSVEEYEAQSDVKTKKSFWSGIVTFISYLVAGFMVILPYIFINPKTAGFISIGISIILLFILGFVSGKISNISPTKKAFTMAIIGGLATILGVLVGYLMS